jgi:eukaryotic-like serine/threonine-protein kinase
MTSAQLPASIAEVERVLGRYVLYGEIARGGMASVHLSRLLGPVGFARTVAIKRLHPHYASNPEVVAMFLEEARLAVRVQHPNVASVLDIVELDQEIFLVMDYVHGESLARLWDPEQPIDPRLAAAVMTQALLGLHAAHEARDERGAPLGIVHRDVSPQNILVGEDGVARVVDFGIAKAIARSHGKTTIGMVKGKLAYMAPERLGQQPCIDRRADIFSAGVVLWELLTGRRLFQGSDVEMIDQLLNHRPVAPSAYREGLNEQLDAVCLGALALEPEHRFASAREMAMALERSVPPAGALEVSAWIEARAGQTLRERAALVAEVERACSEPRAGWLEREAAPRRSEPTRRRRWLMLAAACAVVIAIARLSLGSRAREPAIVQVNAPVVRVVAPPPPIVPSDAVDPPRAREPANTAEKPRTRSKPRPPRASEERPPRASEERPAAPEPRRPARSARPKVDLGL